MQSISTLAIKQSPLAIFRKKVEGKPFTENGPRRAKHGMNGWAEFDGVPGRTQLYFNTHLPEGTPWIERWVTLAELRKTPKPIVNYPGLYIGHWLQRKLDKGRVVLVEPRTELPKVEVAGVRDLVVPGKTERVGRRRGQFFLGGSPIYGC